MELETSVQDTRARLGDISEMIDARAGAQEKKIVSELKVLETLMRDFAGKISRQAAAAVPVEAPAPQRGPTSAYIKALDGKGDMLETIRASLDENRVDLYLQPIVSLPQRSCASTKRFRGCATRGPGDDAGRVYGGGRRRPGLVSAVDNLLLFRCVQIVRRLRQEPQDRHLLQHLAAHAGRQEFFPQFLEFMQANRDLAGPIIFELGQQAVMRGRRGRTQPGGAVGHGFCPVDGSRRKPEAGLPAPESIGFRHLKIRATR